MITSVKVASIGGTQVRSHAGTIFGLTLLTSQPNSASWLSVS